MKAIAGANPSLGEDYVLGAVSCIIWTLTLQTTVKYVLIALHADNKGEGGILALFALLRKMPKRWLYAVAAIGAGALIADGMITPAITVSSAIESSPSEGFAPAMAFITYSGDVPISPNTMPMVTSSPVRVRRLCSDEFPFSVFMPIKHKKQRYGFDADDLKRTGAMRKL